MTASSRPGPRTEWLFLRALGLVYAIAFGSLLPQLPGLIGGRGILPAGEFLSLLHGAYGARAWWLVPTVNWLGASTTALQVTAAAGLAASLLIVAGRWTRPALVAAWALYLSLVGVGQIFLSFQWDALLLEAGFLAIWIDAWPAGVAWLYRWLLFRLLFLSGAVKLLSGDPSWRALTALTYHFETQPLPNRVAWYVHQLPAPMLEGATVLTFAAELLVPLLFFGPRRVRLIGGVLSIGFQVLILLTGNYTFFNLLTIALALWLFDDDALAFLQRGHAAFAPPLDREAPILRRVARAVLIPVAILSVIDFVGVLGVPVPAPLGAMDYALAPLRLTSSYGLFAVMTTTRPEIVFEGSEDGQSWKEYVFPFKPGPVDRPPRQVAPYQPRLDWQLWFAALGDLDSNRWVIGLARRLLEGSPDVLGLVGVNPFPDGPPRYLRALLYDYRFTTPATRRATGRWWDRSLLGIYLPPVTRDQVTPASPAPGLP
jgi:hypothetical protein